MPCQVPFTRDFSIGFPIVGGFLSFRVCMDMSILTPAPDSNEQTPLAPMFYYQVFALLPLKFSRFFDFQSPDCAPVTSEREYLRYQNRSVNITFTLTVPAFRLTRVGQYHFYYHGR